VSRAVFRFHTWALTSLTTDEGHPPIYSAVCARPACSEASTGYTTPEEAERWTLEHASKLRGGEYHTLFRMVIESHSVARPVTETPVL
jgi:hypothetical protein